MNKAIPRVFTAALAVCALALTLWGGEARRAAAAPQTTPLPNPMATAVPSPTVTPAPSPMVTPVPSPMVTPAGIPIGTSWLDKFGRKPTPDPNMANPPNRPAVPAKCRAMVQTKATVAAGKHVTGVTKCKKIPTM